jgi:hypothetical protein
MKSGHGTPHNRLFTVRSTAPGYRGTERRTQSIDLFDYFKRLFALFNLNSTSSMSFTPTEQNEHPPGATTMKTKLILALTLSVLAANIFAADGYDRTIAADGYDRTGSATVAADGFDRTGSATLAADGFDRTGSATLAADGFDRTGSATLAADGFDRTGSATLAADGFDRTGANRLS